MEELKQTADQIPGGVEAMQDFVFLNILFTAKRYLTNYDDKLLLGLPAFMGLVVFSSELSKNDCSFKALISPKYKKMLGEVRSMILKKVPSLGSSKTLDKTISQMGINLNQYTFDIVINTDDRGNVFGINVGTYLLNQYGEDNAGAFNELCALPKAITKTLFEMLDFPYDSFTEELNRIIQERLKNGEFQYDLEPHSYSSYKLFSFSQLSEQNKYYILFRYSLVKALYLLNDIPDIKLKIEFGDSIIDTKNAVMKLKAIVICLLGEDLKKIDGCILEKYHDRLSAAIEEEDFFKQNRAIRDNIHYGQTTKFEPSHLEIIARRQNNYLREVLDIFDQHLTVILDEQYERDLQYAKEEYYNTSDFTGSQKL